MSGSKATVRLIATLAFLSMGFVLYPQGSANAADTYCAKAVGANAAPDCSFSDDRAVSRIGKRLRRQLENEPDQNAQCIDGVAQGLIGGT
jgi:hypothetical protein